MPWRHGSRVWGGATSVFNLYDATANVKKRLVMVIFFDMADLHSIVSWAAFLLLLGTNNTVFLHRQAVFGAKEALFVCQRHWFWYANKLVLACKQGLFAVKRSLFSGMEGGIFDADEA